MPKEVTMDSPQDLKESEGTWPMETNNTGVDVSIQVQQEVSCLNVVVRAGMLQWH